jgi:hypothetical protein
VIYGQSDFFVGVAGAKAAEHRRTPKTWQQFRPPIPLAFRSAATAAPLSQRHLKNKKAFPASASLLFY